MNNKESNVMEILICQYCDKETPGIYNFCAHCHKQLKCVDCGAKTLGSVDFCLGCGKTLIERDKIDKTTNLYTRSVKKHGDNYEENIRFELSDESVGKIAPFIVGQTMPNLKNSPSKALNSPNRNSKEDVEEFEYLNQTAQDETINSNQENEVPSIKPRVNDSQINQYFINDNGNIVAIENDFKGKSWGEQQKNFIMLFTKAYREILGKPIPNKEIIRESAKKLSIIDNSNFSNYLTKTIAEYMTELSNGFELNIKGNKEVEKIIALMQQDNGNPGFNYTSKGTTGPTKKPRISADEKSVVDSWIKDEVDLNKLDLRDVKTGRDAALLSLYIITVKLQKAKACKIFTFMYYLNKKFTTISVSSQAVSKAVSKNRNGEKFFQRNSDEEFFLSTDAQKLVEDWISGAKSIKKEDNQ